MTACHKMTRPPPLPPPALAMPARKKSNGGSACTHMHMTRIYDEYGALTCNHCTQHSKFPWLYRCTQDSNGFLPEGDFKDVEPPAVNPDPQADDRLQKPSQHVLDSIMKGEYTPEQANLLVTQKEGVRAAVLGALTVTRPTTASTSTSGRTSVFTEHLSESTTFSTNTTTPLDEELRQAYDWQELQKAWQAEPSPALSRRSRNVSRVNLSKAPPRSDNFIPTAPYHESHCEHLICAACKPILCERAYQSIDDVVNDPRVPPLWELNNRPISDARVVRNIQRPVSERYYGNLFDSEKSSQRPGSDLALSETDSISFTNRVPDLREHLVREGINVDLLHQERTNRQDNKLDPGLGEQNSGDNGSRCNQDREDCVWGSDSRGSDHSCS